tara:strand:+ start:240 stop:377 length:138 start_codon:yes stop_codon:yes gene_type:complete
MGNNTISGNIFYEVMACQCLTCGGFAGLHVKDNEGLLMPCRCGDA